MLDELGIIHMNGRVYDPLIGRFMSADPFIQAPDNLQSYNRYAYVFNNPLFYTDPSGFSWWTNIRGIVIQAVAAVADGLGCAGYCSAAVEIYNTAKTVKGMYAAYQTGGWSAALKSSVTAYLRSQLGEAVGEGLFGWAGDVGESNKFGFAHYAAHALGGCVTQVASGGSCKSGFGDDFARHGSIHGFCSK